MTRPGRQRTACQTSPGPRGATTSIPAVRLGSAFGTEATGRLQPNAAPVWQAQTLGEHVDFQARIHSFSDESDCSHLNIDNGRRCFHLGDRRQVHRPVTIRTRERKVRAIECLTRQVG